MTILVISPLGSFLLHPLFCIKYRNQTLVLYCDNRSIPFV